MSEAQTDFTACEALVRERQRDRWLASLFAPADVRAHILALYALDAEAARVPEIVSQPTLGEIRLQWWSETLEGERRAEGLSHPIAAAVLDTLARFHLPASALVALIEARRFDLYADPMPSLNDLEGYCGETCSTLFRLASFVSAGGEDPGGSEAAGHAGVAWGLTEIMRALPLHARRSQCYVPRDVLARHGAVVEAVAAGVSSPALLQALGELRAHARRHLAAAQARLGDVAPPARVAFLPLSLVEPRLARMERAGWEPFAPAADLPQWRQQFILWRAARRL
ncbi:MAG: Squalene/phytoene synthase [Hyphomicrobiales bacterium]|nr:Squalene/phytoene synthase [Hyphomicrobiales bacterium]